MPVKNCNDGHKYGDKGKCYKGKDSATKAEKQGRAIKVSQARHKTRTTSKGG